MIVNPTTDGWEVIFQRAHALLAAQLAAHWRTDQRPERWLETLIAIACHDDDGRDLAGKNHLTDAGSPRDFSMGNITLEQPREVIQHARYRGQWVSLMISMHICFLYQSVREQVAGLGTFLDEQVESQAAWRKSLKVSQQQAHDAYRIVQCCDQLSLILCRQELPSLERALEIGKGPGNIRLDVLQRTDSCVTVNPWPFEEKEFTVIVESSHLLQKTYHTDHELLEALENAQPQSLRWVFQR